jgi:hypothetical protein
MASSINASTSGAGGVITTADNTGILNLQTASTTAVTIDASQNVGIGTTSPAYKLDVNGAINSGGISYSNGSYTLGNYTVNRAFATAITSAGSLAIQFDGTTQGFISSPASSSLAFYTSSSGAERMRIDSSGNVLVGTTSQVGSGLICAVGDASVVNPITIKNTGSAAASNRYFAYFINSSNAMAGGISHTASTTTAYTTSSDYRLKENIVPMTGALDTVAQLKPVTYTWKADGSDGQGFIAHELQAVVPDAVVGEKDAVDAEGKPQYQGIDTSFLVATLTAAIQEQQTIINDLKARVTALEAK